VGEGVRQESWRREELLRVSDTRRYRGTRLYRAYPESLPAHWHFPKYPVNGVPAERRTNEGTLDLGAVKDVYSNRNVGYSIGERMKSRRAGTALARALQMR